MKITIKPATIDNLKSIQELNLMLFEKEYKEFDPTLDCKWPFSPDAIEYFTERLTKDNGCVFVAYADEQIVGYLAGGLHEADAYRILPKFAELENMLVLEKYRGLSIGTKLYQAFLDWCKTQRVTRLRVVASAQNSQTINFYRKNGFVDYDLILEKDI